MLLNVLVEPFDEIPPGLLNVGLIGRGTVFSLPVHKAMRLPRKCLNLVINYAVFFKLLGQCRNLIHQRWGNIHINVNTM